MICKRYKHKKHIPDCINLCTFMGQTRAHQIARMVMLTDGGVSEVIRLVTWLGLRGAAAQSTAERAALYLLEGV